MTEKKSTTADEATVYTQTPEELRKLLRAQREDSTETCKSCPWCKGNGMAPASTVDRWLAVYPEVADKEPVIP